MTGTLKDVIRVLLTMDDGISSPRPSFALKQAQLLKLLAAEIHAQAVFGYDAGLRTERLLGDGWQLINTEDDRQSGDRTGWGEE